MKGEIESIFSSTRPSIRRRDHREVPIKATVGDEDECGILTLNRNRLEHLTEKTQKIKLDVTFRERGTQTEETASWSGRLEDKPFKLEVKEGSDQFITGGFPYTGEFTVSNHDGSPREEKVEVCVGFYKNLRPIRDEFNRRGIWSMDEVEIVEMGKRMAGLEDSSKCWMEVHLAKKTYTSLMSLFVGNYRRWEHKVLCSHGRHKGGCCEAHRYSKGQEL